VSIIHVVIKVGGETCRTEEKEFTGLLSKKVGEEVHFKVERIVG